MSDFIFRGDLAEVDPEVYRLTQLEAERQFRKLILIPSESSAPVSVRESLGSVFQNLYAEGYPDEETRLMTEEEILDYPARLAYYRRYSDPRYYKGVEYADAIEALARRRCAEVFATDKVSASQLFVNVQALSGAPANNAVYHLINPGDTVLGMNLLHGGHLSHGSSVNRSGQLYHIVHYNVNPATEQIDYDNVQELALQNKPKMIIAGYSSYPFAPDWERFRAIADSVGAILLADVSHIAGLIAGKALPSPVGLAHVITFTTHKTLCGPRGACIITTDSALAKTIDKAVFPGEQGGPHVHVFAALATTFKFAKTEKFHNLQKQIAENCLTLTNRLAERGLRIPYGGTNTHMGNVDCKTIVGENGVQLTGDLAARILDIGGIVLNRNTIPGDAMALKASGIRYGTPWMTQRGLGKEEMIKVADVMADILLAIKPYSIESRKGDVTRAKISFDVLEDAKIRVRNLAEQAGTDYTGSQKSGYPHFFYLDDKPAANTEFVTFDLRYPNMVQIVDYIFASDTVHLKPGQSQDTLLHTSKGDVTGSLNYVSRGHFQFTVPSSQAALALNWLEGFSNGFIAFDDDLTRRIPGPFTIMQAEGVATKPTGKPTPAVDKPYYIGIEKGTGSPLPEFKWEEKESDELKRTSLFEIHKAAGAKMVPFAGWEMPVWYSSVIEEHLATRQAAGLFDVSHMGVYQVEGPEACTFLDSVCGNDINVLGVGESAYAHFLDPNGNVIDDLLVYRRGPEKYLVVVNASNDDKDRTWLTSVLEGKVMVDRNRPWAHAYGRNAVLRNLRDPKEGEDMRVDIALQGPKSREILLSLGCDAETRKRIMKLKRTQLCDAVVGGFNLVVSRTGYTGEKMAFELFVHPDKAPEFWKALMTAGEPLGLKQCGLGARDSLRTEAGLPLYGHEMAGNFNLSVSEAGFGSYLKTYKPWFIGRDAAIEQEEKRQGEVIRFRFNEKGVRMAHTGDPILDRKGRTIGFVTSCAVDRDGFLTGQAFLEFKSIEDGAQIFVYQGSPASTGKSPSELKTGDRVTLPTAATIVSRYAKL
ncbi:MAG: glycine cleavage system aminomethyltransferase GcvT [Anaerolineaceae bacterium]|nr:glycine cleavage system aminomethyltransferase GcvT [Anaerolineaceae bacterium]